MLSTAAGALDGVGESSPQPALVASLEADLEAERLKTAALEAELVQTRLDAEVNLQKVAAELPRHISIASRVSVSLVPSAHPTSVVRRWRHSGSRSSQSSASSRPVMRRPRSKAPRPSLSPSPRVLLLTSSQQRRLSCPRI